MKFRIVYSLSESHLTSVGNCAAEEVLTIISGVYDQRDKNYLQTFLSKAELGRSVSVECNILGKRKVYLIFREE